MIRDVADDNCRRCLQTCAQTLQDGDKSSVSLAQEVATAHQHLSNQGSQYLTRLQRDTLDRLPTMHQLLVVAGQTAAKGTRRPLTVLMPLPPGKENVATASAPSAQNGIGSLPAVCRRVALIPGWTPE